MKRPSRLMWRLYAVGVTQLLLVASAALLIGYLVNQLSQRLDAPTLIARIAPWVGDQRALESELKLLRQQNHIQITLYDAEGRVLATNRWPPLHPPPWLRTSQAGFGAGLARPAAHEGEPFPPPGEPFHRALPPGPFPAAPPPEPFAGPPGPRPSEAYVALDLGGTQGVLVARMDHPKPSFTLPLLTLLSGLFIVGLAAIFMARFIGRPLERLSRAALAFGQGDLGARVALKRGDELGDVLATFDEMADRIQQLLAAEKELLANVAHELRTPLARIRVALEIAHEGDRATARASLAEIAHDLGELEGLIDDVLSAARFEIAAGSRSPGTFALHIEPISPDVVVARAAERFRSRHPARPLELSVAESLPEIEVDPVLFRRVLDNLLENAHKYSPEPQGSIRLATTRAADRIAFEISDRGLGIASEDLERIFSPFFRAERSRSRSGGGVGLGLTLAKRIVEAHGGLISVSSEAGVGTRVRVEVPVKP